MLAPNGGGLILYQAYGNLYAMTGRKAHLLEDKQIPSVGVFDEVLSTWMAFGGNTHDLGSFGEETDEITDLDQNFEEVLLTEHGDGVAGIKRRRCDPSSDDIRDLLRMTKVIKGEFEKLEDLKVKDVSLTCDTSLKVFNNKSNRLSRMDDDLFTYEVEVANILCDSNKDDDSEQRVSHEADDDMGYDPFDVAFTEWLGLNFFNYKTMDHYSKKALWIYWIREDGEVKLTDEESFDNEDEVAEVFRVDTNIFNFETPM
ncbi:hypothetical protein Tco_1255477 [Tanacetum coccineum]